MTEKAKPYTKHDQLFKQLINTFFEEFLEAFFPEVHWNVDFTAITPLPGEVFTDLIDDKTRRLDIVVETKLKDVETVLIIHVEPQSYTETDFHERMYHYFSLLYNKYRKPILPIAVFSYDENRYEKDEFSIGFPFFHVLIFNFLMLELRKNNWRDYIKSDNPAAAALLSKMGYSEEEKVQVKKEFLRMLVRMELDPAESRLIIGFFEEYLILNEEEEEQLMNEVQQLDNPDEILELPISWEERGIKRGREEGKEAGKEEAMETAAIAMLKKELPLDLIAEVTGLEKEKIEKLKMSL
ncbi:transposase [Virgibacillus sp. NKC19-16]|nr:transposase [Virgibacillus sp. NKC19-16]